MLCRFQYKFDSATEGYEIEKNVLKSNENQSHDFK